MRLFNVRALVFVTFTAGLAVGCGMTTGSRANVGDNDADRPASDATSPALIAEGQRIFRFDTFGDEQLWTDTLRLHEVVEQSVDPLTALKVGFKVDSAALPPGILETVDLTSPATTVALLKMNAIVGIQATVDANDHITRLGVTCVFCHSTVDNSVMPGIGLRQDGWPNRDLNVGAIIALSPVLSAEKKAVYASWGPGRYDPRYNQDGKNTPLVLPPVYGEQGVPHDTAARPLAARAVLPRRQRGTLVDVVTHYNRARTLGLSADQQRDLVEYLKSL